MNTLRIASYNIRKCVGLDWRRNPNRIVDVLAEINADIVLLQEADKRLQPRQGTLPTDDLYHLLGYKFVDVATNSVSHGWHGNAILYRSNRLQVIKTKRIEIPAKEPRGAVLAEFQTLANESQSQKITIIGSHLSLLKGTRKQQICSLAKILQDSSSPMIMGGDLNEKNAETWQDNGYLSNLQLVTAGNSFHASKPILQLDRFIITSDINIVNKGVHTSPLAKKSSDHLPIYMDIVI